MARFGSLKTNNLYIGRSGTLYSESPAQVTATAAQLNVALNNTATIAEVNLLDNMWAAVDTTVAGAGGGDSTVQFIFEDAAGATMATPVAGSFYISEVATGLTVDDADTSIVTLTNGVVTIIDTGVATYYNFVTTAAGLLGITLTAADDDYWIVFKHPTGKLVISDVIAVST